MEMSGEQAEDNVGPLMKQTELLCGMREINEIKVVPNNATVS